MPRKGAELLGCKVPPSKLSFAGEWQHDWQERRDLFLTIVSLDRRLVVGGVPPCRRPLRQHTLPHAQRTLPTPRLLRHAAQGRSSCLPVGLVLSCLVCLSVCLCLLVRVAARLAAARPAQQSYLSPILSPSSSAPPAKEAQIERATARARENPWRPSRPSRDRPTSLTVARSHLPPAGLPAGDSSSSHSVDSALHLPAHTMNRE